jgi:hypothetical protein
MAWGYFDHPPMIALFIKVGSFLFNGEVGVRFITIIAQLITLVILWDIIGEQSPTAKKIFIFFGIAASVVMFQVYGFIATPDSPLLLFVALFLAGYKRFLVRQTMPLILWLAFSMAAMLYSKYHGLLIILFVIASNPRLLLSRGFWLAGIIALIAFIPHIAWQIQNDYPSLRYHLISRSRPVNIRHILNFIPNQLFSFNPFFIGLALTLMYFEKPRERFERSLYFISTGFLVFFFISSFRGHVEPHWTIAASLPMIIIVYRKGIERPRSLAYIHRVLLPSILILLFLRVALIIDFLPVNLKFHGQKEWYRHLAAIAGDTPVVFRNSYQRPSVYTFYTGKPATSLNGIYYRKNQYDIWPFEENLFGKKAILVTNVNDPLATRYEFPNSKKVYLHRTNQFFAVQKIHLRYDMIPLTTMKTGDTITLRAELHNPYPYPIHFNNAEFPVTFNYMFVKSGNDMTVSPVQVSPFPVFLSPGETMPINITFEVPDICPRKYKFGINLQAGILQEAFNSLLTPVCVIEKDPQF